MTLIEPKNYKTIHELGLTGLVLFIQSDGNKGALKLDETSLTGSTGFWTVDVKHQFDHVVIRVGKNGINRLILATHSRTERIRDLKPRGNNKIVHFENYREIGVSTTKKPSDFAGVLMNKGTQQVYFQPNNDTLPVFTDTPLPKRQGTEVITESRPDQRSFADEVWDNCKKRCVISGVTIRSRLQAAHLLSHAEMGPDHYSNGLLLRSDLHGLFDANYLAIEPSTLTVRISPTALLDDPDLEQFADVPLKSMEKAINPRYLDLRWQKFIALHELAVAV